MSKELKVVFVAYVHNTDTFNAMSKGLKGSKVKGYFIQFVEYVECSRISPEWMCAWGILTHLVCEGGPEDN